MEEEEEQRRTGLGRRGGGSLQTQNFRHPGQIAGRAIGDEGPRRHRTTTPHRATRGIHRGQYFVFR